MFHRGHEALLPLTPPHAFSESRKDALLQNPLRILWLRPLFPDQRKLPRLLPAVRTHFLPCNSAVPLREMAPPPASKACPAFSPASRASVPAHALPRRPANTRSVCLLPERPVRSLPYNGQDSHPKGLFAVYHISPILQRLARRTAETSHR